MKPDDNVSGWYEFDTSGTLVKVKLEDVVTPTINTQVVSKMETYDTGATRSVDKAFDPEGFLNPVVIKAFCEYMERHRTQADGNLRDSDNWQKGMPSSRAVKSLTRHFLDVWLMTRGYSPKSQDCEGMMDALCGVLFNTMVLMKNEMESR